MEEIWKSIEGYEGYYEVSNLGRVRGVDRVVKASVFGGTRIQKGAIKKLTQKDNGYMIVSLYKDGRDKHYSVHRLVAQAFIPNPDGLPQVNHKDEDKTNNTVENLEWCDNSYNNSYGTKTARSTETLLNNGKNCQKVAKCGPNGEVLGIYRSLREAERENNLANGILSQHFRNHKPVVNGFIWKKL